MTKGIIVLYLEKTEISSEGCGEGLEYYADDPSPRCEPFVIKLVLHSHRYRRKNFEEKPLLLFLPLPTVDLGSLGSLKTT